MACEACITGNLHTGTPKGEELKIAGLSTYAIGDIKSKRVVVFGTDIFGWKFNNTRLLADEYASHNYRVLVPDLFDGYEIPQWTLSARDPVYKPTLFQRFIAGPISLSILIPFVIRNNADAQSQKLTALVEELRRSNPDAKIGMVGFCWGGRYAMTLNSIFDATVAAHPSLVKYPAELKGISKPISFALAKTDHNYDAARGEDTEQQLKAKGLTHYEVVIYEGVNHGWTIRGDMNDEKKRAARDQALKQAVAWFDKYLS